MRARASRGASRRGDGVPAFVMSCALALFCALAYPHAALGQTVDVGDIREDYLRLLQISGEAGLGSFTIRPVILRADEEGSSSSAQPWAGLPSATVGRVSVFEPLDVSVRAWVNTGYPMTQNDGVVWQGRGLTTAVDLGTTARWRGLRVTVKPTLTYADNAFFQLAPVGVADQQEYAYPWRKIDLPQRFGSDPIWTLHPGQSEVRLTGEGMTGGFSTRNLWWGPGIRSGIIMSNNAAGFPHAFLGTRGARSIGIGTLEANWVWGRLGQSDWFDIPVDSEDRFLTGLVLTYNPSFLNGLSLGLTRVYYGLVSADGIDVSDLFLVLQSATKDSQITPNNPTGDDDKDQMLSFFGRWVLPESGFEVYAEWSRNDHAANITDFFQEPEHSRGYTLGLQKAIELSGERRLALRGELTHLQRSATFQLRASPVYYSHHIVTQGYTHEGQVIGAGIGPGGVQQHLGVDLYAPWGRGGLLFQRRVQDNDAFYDWAQANDASFDQHDVAVDVGASVLVFVNDFEVGGGLIFTRELNRYFGGPHASNLNFSLNARWRPQ